MACEVALTIWAGNTFVVEVDGLRDAVSLAYANSATVTLHLRTFAGTSVTGATWPLTLAYVAASNGKYRGVIPAATDLVVGKKYKYEVSAEQNGATALWSGDLTVENRPLTSV